VESTKFCLIFSDIARFSKYSICRHNFWLNNHYFSGKSIKLDEISLDLVEISIVNKFFVGTELLPACLSNEGVTLSLGQFQM
jgi:hypothetical protein